MLKQKIRKSRKNLLSLLERSSEEERRREERREEKRGKKKSSDVSKGRWQIRETKKFGLPFLPKVSNVSNVVMSPDEGYSTGGDLTSPGTSPGGSVVGERGRGEVQGVQARVRGEEREVRRGEERPVRGQGVVAPWVPVVQVPVRRSSPQEDFLWSLQVCTLGSSRPLLLYTYTFSLDISPQKYI